MKMAIESISVEVDLERGFLRIGLREPPKRGRRQSSDQSIWRELAGYATIEEARELRDFLVKEIP